MLKPYASKLLLRWIALIQLLCLPTVARAEPYQAGGIFPQGYEKLIDEAIHAYRRRNFLEARAQFARANAMFPNARALRGMAMVEYELHNFVDCVLLLRRALESGERPLRGQLRQDTFELLARASAFVAELSIRANAPLTAVLVDGQQVELADGRTLVLRPGEHALEFLADARPAQQERLQLRSGERRRIAVVFAEATPSAVEPDVTELPDEAQAEHAPLDDSVATLGTDSGEPNETHEASPNAPPALTAAAHEEHVLSEQEDVAPSRDDALLGVGASPVLQSEQFANDDVLRVGGEMLLRVQGAGLEEQSGRDYVFSAPSLLDVYLDARPNDRVRAFVLGRLIYDATLSGSTGGGLASSQAVSPTGGLSGSANLSDLTAARSPATVALDQLWLRFDIAHRVFVSAGKQHVRWGTARFWMPTDFLHTRKRNPLDIFDARVGTTMLKLHLPIESKAWNFYAFGVFENQEATLSLGQIAGAARAELVFGTTELGAGVFYRRLEDPKVAVDLSSGLGPFDLYADVAVLPSDRLDRVGRVAMPMIPNPVDPAPWLEPETAALGRAVQIVDATYPVYRHSGYRVQAAGGLTFAGKYNDSDSYTLGAEYFYNQLGYDDPRVYPGLLLPHARPLSNAASLFYLGQHYAALYVALPGPWSLDRHSFTVSTLGNLSDRSFLTRLDYSFQLLTHLRFDAFVSVRYGEEQGEFRLGIRPIDLGGVIVQRAPALVDFGISLRVAM